MVIEVSFKSRWLILILFFLLLVFQLKSQWSIGECFQSENLDIEGKTSPVEDAKQKKFDQNKYKWLFLLDEITENYKPDFFQSLLESGFDVNACNSNGQSLLMLVIKNKLGAEIIQSLIQAGAKVNAQDQEGKTPLMYAAEYSTDLNSIFILLEAGADKGIYDKNGKKAFDYLQKSPLIIQANENYPVACQLLGVSLENQGN